MTQPSAAPSFALKELLRSAKSRKAYEQATKAFNLAKRSGDTAGIAVILDVACDVVADPLFQSGRCGQWLAGTVQSLAAKKALFKATLLEPGCEARLNRLLLASAVPVPELARAMDGDLALLSRVNWKIPGTEGLFTFFSAIPMRGFCEILEPALIANSPHASQVEWAYYQALTRFLGGSLPDPAGRNPRSFLALHDHVERLSPAWRVRLVSCALLRGEEPDYRLLSALAELSVFADPPFRAEFAQRREETIFKGQLVRARAEIRNLGPRAADTSSWPFSEAARKYLNSYRCTRILADCGLIEPAECLVWDTDLIGEIVDSRQIATFLAGEDDAHFGALRDWERDELKLRVTGFDEYIAINYADQVDQLHYRLNERPALLRIRLKNLGFDLAEAMPLSSKLIEQLEDPENRFL